VSFLRDQRPELDRPVKVPFVPYVPALSAVVSLALMASLPAATWLRLVVWMALGVILYFAYGFRHSRVRHPERAASLSRAS
jgi:APA family basic amino acid/polyamine antiporter